MAALSKVGSKVVGPLSPNEFSDASALQTTINTAIQAVSDADFEKHMEEFFHVRDVSNMSQSERQIYHFERI